MRVLDLFSGLRGWSDPFKERGHDVFAIDIDKRFDADAYEDVGSQWVAEFAHNYKPDVILASPPCTSFTTMTMGRNWTYDGRPRTPIAQEGLRLVLATIDIINDVDPPFWIIENPRARLRTLPYLLGAPERRTVTYCRLGERRMKPTDLWGGFPPGLDLPAMCHNGNRDHIAAPRGSSTGTQGGVDSATAGKIPRALSLLVCQAIESTIASEAPNLVTTASSVPNKEFIPPTTETGRLAKMSTNLR